MRSYTHTTWKRTVPWVSTKFVKSTSGMDRGCNCERLLTCNLIFRSLCSSRVRSVPCTRSGVLGRLNMRMILIWSTCAWELKTRRFRLLKCSEMGKTRLNAWKRMQESWLSAQWLPSTLTEVSCLPVYRFLALICSYVVSVLRWSLCC